ncbi:MAG: RNA methyltransferase [Chitinophagaceae bacterium]|nr:MAG: RNA methyltransferase [Chitinophagaceae bacterium]
MPYNADLAQRVRSYLAQQPAFPFEEKELFGGLLFYVNGKMCVNISGDALTCRFDPARQEEVAERPGYAAMVFKGRELAGYCKVDPVGFRSSRDFTWWLQLCLEFNQRAPASKSKAKKPKRK